MVRILFMYITKNERNAIKNYLQLSRYTFPAWSIHYGNQCCSKDVVDKQTYKMRVIKADRYKRSVLQRYEK